MRFVIALMLSVVLGLACSKKTQDVVEEPNPVPSTPAVVSAAEFVGTEVCASCHGSEHADWAGSHHDLAMQKATPETVLGDFDDAKAKYYEETVRFIRDGDSFAVAALGGRWEASAPCRDLHIRD